MRKVLFHIFLCTWWHECTSFSLSKTASVELHNIVARRISSIPPQSFAPNLKHIPTGNPCIFFHNKRMASQRTAHPYDNLASKNDGNARIISNTYRITGILSAIAWITTAYVALSFHPDPKFADCTLRHNLLTMSQAFAFPLPVGWASFHALSNSAQDFTLGSTTSQRLNTGVAVASFWLAASIAYPQCLHLTKICYAGIYVT